MENVGSNPFTTVGSIHGPQAGSSRGYAISAKAHSRVSLAAGFHVYGVEWSPTKIIFTLDGAPYATRTRSDLSSNQSWVFNKPFYLLLNLAVGGTWPGSPNASSNSPRRCWSTGCACIREQRRDREVYVVTSRPVQRTCGRQHACRGVQRGEV